MELTILGSGTAIPRARRGSPGYLVRSRGRTILLDCGPGSLRQAAAAGVSPPDIEALLITHFHPDHNLDLAAFLFANRNWAYKSRGKLSIFAPVGFLKILNHIYSGPQGAWLIPRDYELELNEIGPGRHRVAGLRVEAIHVEHTEQSLAYRLSESVGGPVLAYSGDSRPCDGIVAVGRDADLFLCECALPDSFPSPNHLTPSRVAEVAAAAAPKRLVLTHFYPEVEDEPIEEIVSARYPGPVMRAEDGRTYRIGEES